MDSSLWKQVEKEIKKQRGESWGGGGRKERKKKIMKTFCESLCNPCV